MGHKPINQELRSKAIIVGYFLSRFSKSGLDALGFDGFIQAYNTLGLAIGIRPLSIKSYRDEFDPFFANDRVGRKRATPREYCTRYMTEYSNWSLNSLSQLIQSLVVPDVTARILLEKFDIPSNDTSVAKRLITGRAAEEYFKTNHSSLPVFQGFVLEDMTQIGCGFDFYLTKNKEHLGVEVKGLADVSGSISMTEKEFKVAELLASRYCLFIVSNFNQTPRHDFLFDPARSRIKFTKVETIQISYSARF